MNVVQDQYFSNDWVIVDDELEGIVVSCIIIGKSIVQFSTLEL